MAPDSIDKYCGVYLRQPLTAPSQPFKLRIIPKGDQRSWGLAESSLGGPRELYEFVGRKTLEEAQVIEGHYAGFSDGERQGRDA
jgi:hypothetical protein